MASACRFKQAGSPLATASRCEDQVLSGGGGGARPQYDQRSKRADHDTNSIHRCLALSRWALASDRRARNATEFPVKSFNVSFVRLIANLFSSSQCPPQSVRKRCRSFRRK